MPRLPERLKIENWILILIILTTMKNVGMNNELADEEILNNEDYGILKIRGS
jgi:hypothetical protein